MQRHLGADIARIALFTAIIVICAWISVPVAIPFTMQTFAIILVMGVLGGRRGTFAVVCYLLLGAVGLPVFSGFKGGIAALFGATGGYILGFLSSALIMWAAEVLFGKSTPVIALSAILGLLSCYAFGTAWFMAVYARGTGGMGVGAALMTCVVPYIIPDGIKTAAAVLLANRICKLSPSAPPAAAEKRCKELLK